MLYVVGGHYRDGEDRGDGVYENYVQLMREIGRIWKDSLKGLGGEERLKRIYDKMCEINERGIYEPLEIRNYGVLVDYGMEESKRKGYVFENGYTRIGVKEIDRGLGKGVGIRLRISDNLEVYSGDSGKVGDMFDTLLIGGEKSSRVVIGGEDSSYVRLRKWGLWLRGRRGEKKERKYYLGIDVVREPIGVIVGRKSGEWYSVVGEGKGGGDCVGVIVGGEESIVKVYSLVEGVDGKVDTLRNYGEPKVLLHGGRRIVEVDSNYVEKSDNIEMIIGEGSKIEIKEERGRIVEVEDTSVGWSDVFIFMKRLGVILRVIKVDLVATHLFSSESRNGVTRKRGIMGRVMEFNRAKEDEIFFTDLLKEFKEIKVRIRLSEGLEILDENYKEIMRGYTEKELSWKEYLEILKRIRYFRRMGGVIDSVLDSIEVKGREEVKEAIEKKYNFGRVDIVEKVYIVWRGEVDIDMVS